MEIGTKVKIIDGFKKGIEGIVSMKYESNNRVEVAYLKNGSYHKVLKDHYQVEVI